MYKFALIGGTLEYSYSPMIHSKFGDYEYEMCEVEPDDLSALLHSGIYDGFNVTMPYKIKAMEYCDEISNISRQTGCVNTIIRDEKGKLIGYNTDYHGLRYLLEANNIDVGGQKCIILGSGGASKTAVTVLEDLGAKETVVISRSGENNYSNLDIHYDANIIINTTPVGMFPENLKSLVDLEKFKDCNGVVDLIYNPNRTKLILDAMARDIPCAGGIDMLVAQAWHSSQLFQNEKLDPDAIPLAINEIKDAILNKILIGMPGAGKTYLGRKMAEHLGREFVDMDEEIEKFLGMSIKEIFSKKGEAYFRDCETKLLRETCKKKGLVIATGGGVVRRKENLNIIRQNGIVIWVKRDLDKLESSSRPGLELIPVEILYDERKEAYRQWSDYYIDNNDEGF